MKASTVTLRLACLLLATAAHAQDGPRGLRRAAAPPAFSPAGPQTGTAPYDPSPVKADPKVFPAASVLPTPTPEGELKAGTIVLPTDAIEPWLLTRDAGPFMVMAKTFRGPEAERYALALAKELRRDYNLPAYVMRTKDFPNRTFMRNIPPLAPAAQRRSHLTEPEKVRTYDEAAVLVGNEKTLDDSEALLKRVKKIKPKCLGEMPSIFNWRSGLSTALRTTNPYVPTQDLFPGHGKRDHLIAQMNAGPNSVFHCPGRYTLQVAEYGGRAVFNPSQKDPRMFGNGWLAKSPLVTAADDAERVADALARDPDVRRTGMQPYVYHDRSSSKVMVGSFNDPKDPRAGQLRDVLVKVAVPLGEKTKVLIAPANALTDLEDPSAPIKAK